ncbi:MAG: DUF3131 domain-containing protein [Clostridiales bacterium]|nr:DUF3131 domain-containing protein [Clostridiales bacterium]
MPPDNFQEYPPNKLANRTSPTNIGLYIMSVLCARDFGYISTRNMLKRIDETISTIEKMETWKGHLYNWYDTRTLEVLRPQYISTVDSGNFISYLITVNEGLKDYQHEMESNTKYKALSDRINKVIEATQFIYLYDVKRHLFSIGYHVEDEKLTNSYYDLLASEARVVSYIAIAGHEIPMKH